MAGADHRKVARAPLFDRLVDGAPDDRWEDQAYRTLDRAGLRQSVIHEVSRLLNTRCPIAAETLTTVPRDTLNYGVPDLAHFAPRNHESEIELTRTMVQAIRAYEPRLTDVAVAIDADSRDRNRLTVRVEGQLRVGDEREPLSFDVVALGDDNSPTTA